MKVAWILCAVLAIPCLHCSTSGSTASSGGVPANDAGPGAADSSPAEDAGSTQDGSSGPDSASSPLQVCKVACTTTDDCAANGGGQCKNGACDVSASGTDACSVDVDCIPYGSSFEIDTTCASQADCTSSEACIAWNGKGVCQMIPTSSRPCSDFINMVEIDWKDIQGNTVKICGRTNYRCDAGKCRAGCSQDSECTSNSTPKCDVGEHKCVCTATSCAGGTFNGEVCMPNGACGCNGDTDCKVLDGFDKCYGGTCGCSGNAACAGLVSGVSVVCVPK